MSSNKPVDQPMGKKADIFVFNPSIHLVDNDKIPKSIVNYTSYARRCMKDEKQYFAYSAVKDTIWPQSTDQLCLHCCLPFSTFPVPIPRYHDSLKNTYYVFGIFCSINCAKAYIIEHDVSISNTRMLYFISMCRTVFDIHYPVKPAPPRVRLKMFGGDLTPEKFRQYFDKITTRILRPPFVQYTAVIEETKVTSNDKPSELNICVNATKEESTYSKFVKPVKKRKSNKLQATTNGTLSEFIRLK